jgi:DNA-binding IclR family transcriptional regulator
MRMTKIDDLEPPNSFTTYTIRISATAKPEIREALERGYGYNASTIYPDIMGLAEKGANLI